MMQNPNNDERTSPVLSMEVLQRCIQNPYGMPVIINGMPQQGSPQTEKEDKASGVKAALFIIFFIAAIIAAIIFAEIEPLLCITTVGALFLILGSAAVFQNGFKLENAPALIVPIVGLLMTGLPILILYGRKHPEHAILTSESVIPIILGCMVLLGICLMFFPPLAHSSKMRRCAQTVNAVCIYRTYHTSRSKGAGGRRTITHLLYNPVWQYTVNGTIYVSDEHVYSNFDIPEIGGVREIRYDPQNPAYIYRPQKGLQFVPMLIGLMFTLLAGIALFIMLK